MKYWRDIQTIEPKQKSRSRYYKLDSIDDELLKQWLDDNLALTLQQLKKKIQDIYGSKFKISLKTLSTHLKKNISFTLKTMKRELKSRNIRSTIQKKYDYTNNIIDTKISMMNNMIFIDKSRFNLYLYRYQGRVVKGYIAKIIVLDSKDRNISIIYTISKEGIIKFDHNFGGITGEIFTEFMGELLTLFTNSPKKYFILDNAKIHHYYKL